MIEILIPQVLAQGLSAPRPRDRPPRPLPGLAVLLATIDQLSAQLDDLDESVERLCRERYPEVAGLQQIGGVGPITGLSFVLTLEDPARFADSRIVGA